MAVGIAGIVDGQDRFISGQLVDKISEFSVA